MTMTESECVTCYRDKHGHWPSFGQNELHATCNRDCFDRAAGYLRGCIDAMETDEDFGKCTEEWSPVG